MVLALLALVGAAVWWVQSGAAPALPPGGGVQPAQPAGAPEPAAATRGLPDGVVATRAEAVEIDPGALADRPTVCLRVLDHGDSSPVSGAIVRRLSSGADLAFTDERGLAFVPLEEAAQLAVVHERYLLRLAPARPGSDEQSPQVVRLVPDFWSSARRFSFVGPDGEAVRDVFVQLRPASGAAPVDNGRAATMDEVVRRAWNEHLMMASREVSRDQHVHAGARDAHVYRAVDAEFTVRFVAAGDYTLQAATTTGLVGAAAVVVGVGPAPPAQVVQLVEGGFVEAVVRDTAGGALAGATVTVQGGEPLGLQATTDTAGAFAIGPLPPGARTLLVRHALHRPVAVDGVPVPSSGREIVLEPLQRSPLRGRVRARPSGAPIAGATVMWQVAGGGAVTTRTGADGTFELQAAGDIAARLAVQAPHYVTYAELVDPGAAFQEYDLLPASRDARVEAGLTATVEGVAFGSNGFPVAGASVRWQPANPVGGNRLPGRRVLQGFTLELSDVTTTDSSGAFVIETTRFGEGTVTLDGETEASVTAVAGRRLQNLELGR